MAVRWERNVDRSGTLRQDGRSGGPPEAERGDGGADKGEAPPRRDGRDG